MVGAGVALVVIVVVITFGSGGDDGGGTSAPATVPSVSSSAAAHDLATHVTLAPADWGSAYVRDSPYEGDRMAQTLPDQNCKIVAESLTDALANQWRNVKDPDNTAFASSTLTVYKGADFAKRDIARQRDALRQCPSESEANDKRQWDNVHEVKIPALKGFDDVVAEEGHLGTNEKGQKTDTYYVSLTGSRGQYVLNSTISRGPDTQEQNRTDAADALSLMLSRLASR
ncbi:hypothetical protein OHA45_13895 [Streptomyces lydicus]|uniref:hypothetical protein n=1 Tax=Streptomyces lydicus TaxID=47763 RepID=UPI002E338F3F|nr:hypothetical protein [Streptomyces lydicus]